MFEELKTFIAVVEFKNFTKASEYLHISQPSVSTHIKNLEKFFGVILINRSIKQKSIMITESGQILYKRAKEIINLLDITKLEVSNVSDSLKGRIKVGASLTIGEYILPKFLSTFIKKYPDIDVEIFIENTSLVCSSLKDLKLDIGLIEGISHSLDFNQKYFLKDKMVLALPYNSDLLSNNFTYDKLQNQKWIVRESGSGTRESLNMFLNVNEISPKNIMMLGSNYAVKEAVKNNLGVTIISNFIAYPSFLNKELSIIDLDDNYNRHFSYITPKNMKLSKASEVFISELNQYALTLQ